jgi:integrase
VRPYIFSEAEVARLLSAARGLQPTPVAPLRPQVFHLAIVLLYAMGLRRGELLRLTAGDHDAREQTLLVRESKFHKSRLLPMSSDVARELEEYLAARRTCRLPVEPSTPLIGNLRQGGRPYTGTGLIVVLQPLMRAVAIRKPDGRAPRVHDLRHAFAVNALLRWYRAGADVEAKLPLLAAYMGHVSVTSTQHYLHFVQPLAAAASERFARLYAQLAAPAPARSWGHR